MGTGAPNVTGLRDVEGLTKMREVSVRVVDVADRSIIQRRAIRAEGEGGITLQYYSRLREPSLRP